jgi:galactokinase
LRKNGRKIGGFCAKLQSDIPTGAGVSSSAAFEMLIGQIISSLYNGGEIPVAEMSRAGSYAENVHWKKGSGLLDQMACGIGGLAAMDFADPDNPVVEKVPFDFAKSGYRMFLVNAGGSHAGLADEYSSMPREMKEVAAFFGKEVLRGVTEDDLLANAAAIRAFCNARQSGSGDRAFTRAVHFVEENIRVDGQTGALKAGNFSGFLRLVQESGNSSFRFLQNCYINPAEEPIPCALALTELFIAKHSEGKIHGTPWAASRIHGGGLAGCIQVWMPEELAAAYTACMDKALGPDEKGRSRVYNMVIRPQGVVEIK